MAMSIPTRNDWGNIDQDDLDANWALKNFLGKSSAEAMQLFKENAFFTKKTFNQWQQYRSISM